METPQIEHEQLQQLLRQLDQGLHHHHQWYQDLVRSMVCRLEFDDRDLKPDAHKHCRFGKWYLSKELASIRDNRSFVAIGDAHEFMHNTLRCLLTKFKESRGISTHDYDAFANSLERFKLEVEALKIELESLINYRDPLTMAITRVNMLPILREHQEQAKRQDQPYCIAMMDIDFFKKVNDEYGHPIGDKVLATLSRFVINHVRSYDKVFRYGGEEFLICLQQTDCKKGFEIIENIRTGISKLPIDVGTKKPLQITVSFGVAELNPNESIESWINRADEALYLAKHSGRNRTESAKS